MRRDQSALMREIVRTMDGGNTLQASQTLARLEALLRQSVQRNGLALHGLLESYTRLLRRRGFFVSTPDEIAASLDEIRAVGAGFDLYELARALARCDLARTAKTGTPSQPLFPQLQLFAQNPEVST